MKNKALMLRLLLCAIVAFLFTIARYMWVGGNPLHRWRYGLFVSVLPVLGALLWIKFRKLSLSWQQTAGMYFLLFVLISIIQLFGRMIPVYDIVQNLRH